MPARRCANEGVWLQHFLLSPPFVRFIHAVLLALIEAKFAMWFTFFLCCALENMTPRTLLCGPHQD